MSTIPSNKLGISNFGAWKQMFAEKPARPELDTMSDTIYSLGKRKQKCLQRQVLLASKLEAIHLHNKIDAEKILKRVNKREFITKRLGSGTLQALDAPAAIRTATFVTFNPNSEKVHDMAESIHMVDELAQLDIEIREINREMETLSLRRNQMFKSVVSGHKNWYIENFEKPGNSKSSSTVSLPAIGKSQSQFSQTF